MFNYTYKTTISGEIQINNFYLNEFKSGMSCKYGGEVSLMVSQGISEAWSEKKSTCAGKNDGGNRMSMVLSSSRLRSLVTKSPAAEKALSASTLVGGIDFNQRNQRKSQVYFVNFQRKRPIQTNILIQQNHDVVSGSINCFFLMKWRKKITHLNSKRLTRIPQEVSLPTASMIAESFASRIIAGWTIDMISSIVCLLP